MIWKRSGTDRQDRQFFHQLVEAEIDALHRTAWRLSGDDSEAEELVQEVFLKAWKSIGQLSRMEHPRAWIFRVLRTTWIDRLRKKSRRPQLVELEEATEAVSPKPVPLLTGVEERAEWNEFFDAEVSKAIDELPEGERQVLLYSTFGELSYREIAEVMECPTGTVMSRLHRARSRLQKKLAGYAESRGIIKKEGRNRAEG